MERPWKRLLSSIRRRALQYSAGCSNVGGVYSAMLPWVEMRGYAKDKSTAVAVAIMSIKTEVQKES